MRSRLLTFLARIETRALLIWIAGAGSIWTFLNLAGEVSEGETEALDRHLLLMLRNRGDLTDPVGPRWLEEGLRDVTALGGTTVLTLVTVVAILLFALHRRYRQAAVLGAVVLCTHLSTDALKAFYDRPRPSLVPHGSFVYSQSFPSGHSTLSAATYLTLAMLVASLETRRAIKVLIFVIAALLMIGVGFSRVYLGVHWPSDVLAGWSLGAAWSFVGWVGLDRWRRRETNRAG